MLLKFSDLVIHTLYQSRSRLKKREYERLANQDSCITHLFLVCFSSTERFSLFRCSSVYEILQTYSVKI